MTNNILTAHVANMRHNITATSNSNELQTILTQIKDVCDNKTKLSIYGDLKHETINVLRNLGYNVHRVKTANEWIIDWTTKDKALSGVYKKLTAQSHKQTVTIILCIIIILLLLFLTCVDPVIQTRQVGLIALLDIPEQVYEIPGWDPNAVIPPTDDKVEKLNEKLDKSKMCINMLGHVIFDNTYDMGYMNIINDEANNYPQFVTITLDGSDIIVYQSGLIDVGKGIPYAKLDVVVPAGEHKCTAVFTQVDTTTNEICGQAAAKIVLTVKE